MSRPHIGSGNTMLIEDAKIATGRHGSAEDFKGGRETENTNQTKRLDGVRVVSFSLSYLSSYHLSRL